jgi:adenosylcobinamide kinase/adenosylcobinamide-phosphate guanylyltransferase
MRRRGKETVLVTGGCRSGKSRFAMEWAENRGPRRLFLATAQALDTEMLERIRRHREARGKGWATAEEPLDVTGTIREQGAGVDVILLDCVTLWVSNLVAAGLSDEEVLARVRALGQAMGEAPCSIGTVTNEVGWGIVPDHPLGRRFRDLTGSANQLLAEMVETVVLVVAGVPMVLKPSTTRRDRGRRGSGKGGP